jgi:DNA-binding LacI/PurR family transcriptional regulator
MKRININDVAQAAGVHRSTVSRALTGSGPVSADNRERVMAAVRSLNYHPDTMAGALKSRRKNTWGFLSFWYYTPNSMDHFYSKALGGLLDAANRASVRLLLQNVVGRFDENEECLRFCHDAQLAGLVVLAPRTREAGLKELKRLHVPAVLLSYRPQDPELSFVDLDNVDGARQMTVHLGDQGHKRIAYIGGELELSANARDRYEGYLQGLRQFSLPVDADLIRHGSFEPAFAVATLDGFLALPASRRPTAIFCATDPMARAVIDDAQRRGLKVPRDLAVAGFDDNPVASAGSPGLTTVRYPFFEAGARAGDVIDAAVKGAIGPVRELLRPELVLRESA